MLRRRTNTTNNALHVSAPVFTHTSVYAVGEALELGFEGGRRIGRPQQTWERDGMEGSVSLN